MLAGRRLQVYAAIALINVGLYLLLALNGVDWLKPDPNQLIAWGANVPALTLIGEPWRLLTNMFLHMGLLHLALNTCVLVVMGEFAEETFGRLRFTLLYLISGLCASLASALWHGTHQVSETFAVGAGQVLTIERLQLKVAAGASGALMGLAGALLVHLLIARARKIPNEDIDMRGPLALAIALTVVPGFFFPIIDNAGHIGGVLAGALVGGAFALSRRNLAIVAISGALLFFGLQVEPSAELQSLKKLAQKRVAAVR
jgi:rhomboid protease GluP